MPWNTDHYSRIQRSRVWSLAMAKINQVQNPVLRSEMLEAVRPFRYVFQLHNRHNDHALQAYFNNPLCNEQNTKFALRLYHGQVFVYGSLWKRLSLETQVILVFHEILRVGQMHYRIFNINNQQLQEMAMDIYLGKI